MTVLEQLASEAIRLGFDMLEVEYKDGCEEVVALKGGLGFGIARFPSASLESTSLREELYQITKKRRRRRLTVENREYDLRGRMFESFGENAFRVELRCVQKSPAPDRPRRGSRRASLK